MKLTETAWDALEELREHCGHHWRSPSAWLVEYDSKSKAFTEGSLAYKQWQSLQLATDDIDVEGVAIGYTREIVPVASMLDAVDFDPRSDFSVLFLPIDLMRGAQSTPESQRAYETLVDELPVVFDERKENVPVKTVLGGNRSFWWRPEFVYKGDKVIDDALAYIYCRNRFLDIIDTVWNNSFIIRPRESEGKSKSIRAISRASKVANLLLLDKGDFDVFAKKGKCPTWQVNALRKLDIDSGAFSPEMREVFAEVSRLQDVADFWCTAADYYGWALRLSTADIEDGKIEETKKKIATMAELIDLEVYLDAYEAGVPACDILA